jgi:hypothetical protein
MALHAIAAIQVVILLLLCIPQKRRPIALGAIVVLGAAFLAFRRLRPIVSELFSGAIRQLVVKFGEFHLILAASVLVFAILLVVAYRMDTRQIRAIRAGSRQAFDQYVNDLIRKKHYNLEEATAAVIQIRDGKKKAEAS